MKVIFVDIDGPLSWGEWLDGKVQVTDTLKIPYAWVKKECDALAEIIRKTEAKVVICSDWKKHYSIEELGIIFEYYGIPNTIIGITSERKAKLSSPLVWDRAVQIADWVNEHEHEIEAWLAIDDLNIGKYFDEMSEEYPHISKNNHFWAIGDWSETSDLISENVNKIIESLNGKS